MTVANLFPNKVTKDNLGQFHYSACSTPHPLYINGMVIPKNDLTRMCEAVSNSITNHVIREK
jgi:hypothetical protein